MVVVMVGGGVGVCGVGGYSGGGSTNGGEVDILVAAKTIDSFRVYCKSDIILTQS